MAHLEGNRQILLGRLQRARGVCHDLGKPWLTIFAEKSFNFTQKKAEEELTNRAPMQNTFGDIKRFRLSD